MNYIEQLKEYSKQFPKEYETECLIQIKKMRQKGFSYRWIATAILHKQASEWMQWGFGLLHTDNYQKQINNLIKKEDEQVKTIDVENVSWDELEKESSYESTNNSLSNNNNINNKIHQVESSRMNCTSNSKTNINIDDELYKRLDREVKKNAIF